MPKKRSDPTFRSIVFYKYNGNCAYCGVELTDDIFHIDHLIPKRRYKYNYLEHTNLQIGSDDIDNLMPSCGSCNSCKSDLTLEEFRDRISDRLSRLNNYSSEYQISKRFGLITENEMTIIFHFEKNNNG